MKNGQNRSDVTIGARVSIVLKADQATGRRTEGVALRLLNWGARRAALRPYCASFRADFP